MKIRRTIVVAIALAGLLVVTFAIGSELPLSIFYRMAMEEIFPGSISWDGHTAWKRCTGAIAGRTSWPDSPRAACAAMQLCANEATLSSAEQKLLDQSIQATPKCEQP